MENRQNEVAFDQQRLEKREELCASGVSFYPPEFKGRETILAIKERFAGIGHEKSEESVCTAGRLYTIRNHGKTVFADLQDGSGRIQLYIRKNEVGEETFNSFLKTIERGDIIGVSGHVFRTKVGEITLWVEEITLSSLFSCPIPVSYTHLRRRRCW